MSKILIVEDEVKLRKELKTFLENNGYEVLELFTFDDVVNQILKIKFDLLLLDINLPNVNGEYILKEIRKELNTPVIIVTSMNTEIDELLSINYGADDFITKPYNSQILLARIDRILKRKTSEIITYNDLILDIFKYNITYKNKTYDLSKNEFKILYYLITNKGVIVSRDDLINYLWDNNEFIDDNTLTVNINRIRNKIKDIIGKNIIVTKRAQGYMIL